MKLTYIFNREITSEKASLVQAVYMCDAFASKGVSVEMAFPAGKKEGSKDYLVERFGIRHEFKLSYYTKIMLFNRLGIIGAYFGIKKFLMKSQADLYFTRCPMIFTFLADKRLPVIFEAHNANIHNDFELYDKFWMNKVINASRKKNCLAFITISENLGKHWAEKGVPASKITALHDGFSNGMFKDEIDKLQARSELNLPLESKIITYTGSLYRDREIENIINLAARFPDSLFLVVGGPQSDSDHYKSIANENEVTNIKFTGPVAHSKIPLYLYASDVLLALWSKKVPTINYCSPLKIFEYMAAGRNIVAHSFPTIKEVIRHQQNGLLADPDDFNDLVDKTAMALSINDRTIEKQARDEAFREYPWDKRAEKILKKAGVLPGTMTDLKQKAKIL